MPEPAVLSAHDVSVVYAGRATSGDVHAVRNLDFSLRAGEFVCLVGPSGCGKTTFLNAVAGFLPVSDGELTLDGLPILAPSPKRAMVFQQPSLLPWRSVLRNVTYGLEMSGLARGEAAAARARDLLELVGLADFADAFPNRLSGGMQQRVNLARALAVEPELLLLDEPFASVDAQTRENLQQELLAICSRTRVTALFVTHDIGEAVYLADRVCVFGPRPGRITRDISVDLDRPRPPECRREPRFLALADEVAGALAEGYRGAAAR